MSLNYLENLANNIQQALAEDLGHGDLSAELIPLEAQAQANIICREEAIICGRPWFDGVFQTIDPTIRIDWFVKEGDQVKADTLVCTLSGPARALLSAERSALNFLQTLSATATRTSTYVKALGETSTTQLLDTRKTLPGLRLAQKYAVHCGGGTNHRIGLYDAILLKENHIMAAGGIAKAVEAAHQLHPTKTVEVETETFDEVRQAVEAGADIIMLDNFTLEQIEQAVAWVAGRAKLEVSGNVERSHLAELAQTQVDFISTGAITKHIQAIDFSMRFQFNA